MWAFISNPVVVKLMIGLTALFLGLGIGLELGLNKGNERL